MPAAALLCEAASAGVTVRLVDGKLRATGPEAEVDRLMPELKAEREAITAILAGGQAGEHIVRLCRLLDEAVETKYGRGRLWQVFADRVAVVIEPGHLTFMQPEDVRL